jgi:hypothetical protein
MRRMPGSRCYLPDLPADAGQPAGGLRPHQRPLGLGSAGEDYVTLALGRDYADVSPMRGVIHGGASHQLRGGDGAGWTPGAGPGPLESSLIHCRALLTPGLPGDPSPRHERLRQAEPLNITLPPVAVPAAAYVPFVQPATWCSSPATSPRRMASPGPGSSAAHDHRGRQGRRARRRHRPAGHAARRQVGDLNRSSASSR